MRACVFLSKKLHSLQSSSRIYLSSGVFVGISALEVFVCLKDYIKGKFVGSVLDISSMSRRALVH